MAIRPAHRRLTTPCTRRLLARPRLPLVLPAARPDHRYPHHPLLSHHVVFCLEAEGNHEAIIAGHLITPLIFYSFCRMHRAHILVHLYSSSNSRQRNRPRPQHQQAAVAPQVAAIVAACGRTPSALFPNTTFSINKCSLVLHKKKKKKKKK